MAPQNSTHCADDFLESIAASQLDRAALDVIPIDDDHSNAVTLGPTTNWPLGPANRKETTMSITAHHQVLIIGGGTAGISVAARLQRAGIRDIGIVEPAITHYYQPLWTLVGGGRAPVE
ncbi:hypothetical protein ACWD25_42275, partial [Streptomyces sp. NPDC002920]